MFISFPFLKIFLSAHVIITEITAFGMFTNLCLVLLLVRADSLFIVVKRHAGAKKLRKFFEGCIGARHVYKALLGSSVTSCRLACSEILTSIDEKRWREVRGNCRALYKLADGVTSLTQLRFSFFFYYDKTRSFNLLTARVISEPHLSIYYIINILTRDLIR